MLAFVIENILLACLLAGYWLTRRRAATQTTHDDEQDNADPPAPPAEARPPEGPAVDGAATEPPASAQDSIESGLFASAFFMSKMPFLLLDSEFKIIYINKQFTLFTGYTEHDCHGKHFVFLEPHIPAQDFASTISAFLRKDQTQLWSGEIICHRKNGECFPAKLLVSPIINNNGTQTVHYFAYLFDISKQKETEQRITRIVHYDDLTGLPNRNLFCEQLAKSLQGTMRQKLYSAVVFLNIDRFKLVNDSLGRQAGDGLLKEVANRLIAHLGKEDAIARISGDEFAIMHLNEASHEKAIYSASILAQNIISRLSKQFHIHRQQVFISVSIGIAIFPEDAHNAEGLLKNAEIAMLTAKKQGTNKFHFFDKKYTSTAKEKHQLELNLRRAMQKGELRLYYQPQYTAKDQKLYGAEVLIRWLQGQTKLVSPYYFIDVAEETGLIIPIGKWILESACKQLMEWLQAGYHMHQVSVNVSARQFMDVHFVETVEHALVKTGLAPHRLELEITESMLIGDTKKIELQLNRFKKMGIKIALDDFGTGYSSLAYLKNFPIDVVKIDQSFVRHMTPGSKDAGIVCAIIEMGHSLGYKVVAEGVENEAQLEFLGQKGCDIIQGYYFSQPVPAHEMAKRLNGDAG